MFKAIQKLLVEKVHELYRSEDWGFAKDSVRVVGQGEDVRLQFKLPSESDKYDFKEALDCDLADKQIIRIPDDGRVGVNFEVRVADIINAPSMPKKKKADERRVYLDEDWRERASSEATPESETRTLR